MEISRQFLFVCAIWCISDQVHSILVNVKRGASSSESSIAMPPPRESFSECGKSKKTDIEKLTIVHGTDAKLGSWPWMVGLMEGSPKNASNHTFCGGSLISRQWVITTAHCIVEFWDIRRVKNIDGLFVRLGDLDLDDQVEDGASPLNALIKELVPHPQFARGPATNDIGLVLLKDPVTFTENIRPICLPSGPEYKSNDYYYGKQAMIIGWGDIESGNETKVYRLQEASVPVVTQEICKRYFNLTKYFKIDEKVICAGGIEADACQGDSGGPLMFLNQTKARYYVGGISSCGFKCAVYPGVYTKVASFISWIRNVTNENL